MTLPPAGHLRLADVLPRLMRHHEELARHIDRRAGSPTRGAWISPRTGLAEPGHTGTAAHCARAALLALAAETGRHGADPRALARDAAAGLRHILGVQRPSGLIDLRPCNYDSAPDTAFAVQLLCALVHDLRSHEVATTWAGTISALAERVVRRAFPGMLSGGFHTPNHRWVIASAIAWSRRLFPDLDDKGVLAQYLAEGVDIDGEGSYIERSAAIYDAVTNRSLLLLHEHAGWDQALPAVRANLRLNLLLVNADGTIETALSRRQDRGTRVVPLNLAPCYLQAARLLDGERAVFTRAAHELWRRSSPADDLHAYWLAHALLATGDPPASAAALPCRFERWLPGNRLWRVRRGDLAGSFLGDSTLLGSVNCGQASMDALRICQSYFGAGRFIADRVEAAKGRLVMVSEGRHYSPLAPAYQLPVGRPVPTEDWEEERLRRPMRELPPCRSRLEVRTRAGGFEFSFSTLEGLDGVPVQIALDFRAGATWESAGITLAPSAGQVIFLTGGTARMAYPDCTVELTGGAGAHRYAEMADIEPVRAGCFRVVIALLTPARHRFGLRFLEHRG